MPRRRRSTLKHFFRKGALPSADQFGDLIDSMVNQVDDGFDKSESNGLEISTLGAHDSLISFFRRSRSQRALWTIGYDEDRDKLLFKKLDDQPGTVLSLSPEGKVGINRKDPLHQLDVDGFIRAKGRIGVAASERAVAADGRWHDITETLTGCHALEVIAGVGKRKTGRYALLHAIAMNAYNPTGWLFNLLKRKNRIRCHHAYYNARVDKLQLRWDGRERNYRLQLRTRCHYGDGVVVRYFVTRLWADAGMESCLLGDDAAEPSGAPHD